MSLLGRITHAMVSKIGEMTSAETRAERHYMVMLEIARQLGVSDSSARAMIMGRPERLIALIELLQTNLKYSNESRGRLEEEYNAAVADRARFSSFADLLHMSGESNERIAMSIKSIIKGYSQLMKSREEFLGRTQGLADISRG